MNKKYIIILLLLFNLNIFAIEIYPRNIFLDRYELIPPLGFVKSIAVSMDKLFAISDNYLLIFAKHNLELIRTTYFNQEISLVAYDPFYDEVYISSVNCIIRYNVNLGSVREYPFSDVIGGIGFTRDRVYIQGQKKYSFDRMEGNIEQVSNFPDNVIWQRAFDKRQVTNYKFLTPYYYQDDFTKSNDPFYRYEITALCDDGIHLYVGTNQFGILRYNKVSLQQERIVYGPLTTNNLRLKKIGDSYYFISQNGISSLKPHGKKTWEYFRLRNNLGDFLIFNNELIVSIENQLTRINGAVSTPIAHFNDAIISLNLDEASIYIGTNNGLYRILKETSEPLEFGPERYPVYVIYPTSTQIFVGGEFALYRFDRNMKQWYQVVPYGVKDICEADSKFYFLTLGNQLVQYLPVCDSISLFSDSINVVLLPFFNIYDIDSDGRVIYCATSSGINYFDPETHLYNPVYNLPRIRYNYVVIADQDIIAVSGRVIYRLPLKYRN